MDCVPLQVLDYALQVRNKVSEKVGKTKG